MRSSNLLKRKSRKLAQSLHIEEQPIQPMDMKQPVSLVIRGWLMLVVGLLCFLFYFQFMIARVSGPSMNPTLHHNQMLLVSKHDRVDRFDIVVLKERLAENGETKNIVKRVIAFGGERVVVVNGQLFINNVAFDEYYLDKANIKQFKKTSFEITVPKGYVFVMGDNRDVSKDSRAVGSFKKDAILGVALVQSSNQ